ncbi:ComEC/Rec2 family competence protein [Affinirhizobium pseudoryzae]|uniref:ComEC/Rec2 family competence protein n=1 Tax=Allorhizobium pseudoryzae TaxID=379684 RepID=UPI001F279016|nr:ComEC/Rec2 family competence protein [Allorhizobium pseudoryzae]
MWLSLPQDPPPALFGLLVPLLAVRIVLGASGQRLAASAVMAVVLFITGMALAALETRFSQTVLLDSAVTTQIKGLIERREAAGDNRWRYIIRVEATEKPRLARPVERVAISVRSAVAPFAPGARFAGRVRLSPPSGPALPGLTDFGFSSFFDGIGAIGYLYGKAEVSAAKPDLGTIDHLKMAVFALRGMIGDRIRATVPGDAGAFAAAIVTDERRAISRETLEALRLSGLAHIVAISGLNMALAAGICFVGLRTGLALFPRIAHALPIKKIAAAGALLLVSFYYLISGFGVSAERAYVMMAIMLLAVLADRPSISLHNLALAALFILIKSPSAVMGPSFQMSFAATAALVAGYTAWTSRERENGAGGAAMRAQPLIWSGAKWVWLLLAGTFFTSLIGGASTAIFTIAHFHQLTTYGLVANLAAMPLISFVIMPAALAGMIAMPFGLDAPFFAVMGLALEWVIRIAHTVAAWNGEVSFGVKHALFLPLASAGFILIVLSRTALRLLGVVLIAMALLVDWLSQTQRIPDLLISEDGTLLALLQNDKAYVNRPRPSDFLYRQWQSAHGIGETIPPQTSTAARPEPEEAPEPAGSTAVKATVTDGPPPRRPPLTDAELRTARQAFARQFSAHTSRGFHCVPSLACTAVTEHHIRIMVLQDSRYIGPACDEADLVVATSTRLTACRSGALLITGEHLRRTGALQLSFPEAPGASRDQTAWVLTASFTDESRPWHQHRAYSWRTGRNDNQIPPHLARLISGNGG